MLLLLTPQPRRAEIWCGRTAAQAAANDPVLFQPTAAMPLRATFHRPKRHETDWTEGLTTRTANALRAYGLRNRWDVMALPKRMLQRIPNLGRASLQELQLWLQQKAAMSAIDSNEPTGEKA